MKYHRPACHFIILNAQPNNAKIYIRICIHMPLYLQFPLPVLFINKAAARNKLIIYLPSTSILFNAHFWGSEKRWNNIHQNLLKTGWRAQVSANLKYKITMSELS